MGRRDRPRWPPRPDPRRRCPDVPEPRPARRRFGPGTELAADYFHPRVALSGRHPIVKATGARFRSGARNGRALAAVAPGWQLIAEYGVMESISARHRTAAVAFRFLTLSGRVYAVARLTVR